LEQATGRSFEDEPFVIFVSIIWQVGKEVCSELLTSPFLSGNEHSLLQASGCRSMLYDI
jgi:hypothetical protein